MDYSSALEGSTVITTTVTVTLRAELTGWVTSVGVTIEAIPYINYVSCVKVDYSSTFNSTSYK